MVSGCSTIFPFPQRSEATGIKASASSKSVGEEHSAIRSKLPAAVIQTGAAVSSMIKDADVFALFPHSSVAVKVTTVVPVSPHKSDGVSISVDQIIIPPQISEAVAPAFDVNHAVNSARFPAPSHSTVMSDAAISMLGAVVSTILKVAVVDAVFPQSSVAVNVTKASPVCPHKFEIAE